MDISREAREQRNEKVARSLADGATPQEALLKAGYSPKSAIQGKWKLPQGAIEKLAELKGKDFAAAVELGRRVKPEEMRLAVLGGLARGVADRDDKGVQMLKLAGNLKELQMFTPESQIGVIVLGAPQAIGESPAEMPQVCGHANKTKFGSQLRCSDCGTWLE